MFFYHIPSTLFNFPLSFQYDPLVPPPYPPHPPNPIPIILILLHPFLVICFTPFASTLFPLTPFTTLEFLSLSFYLTLFTPFLLPLIPSSITPITITPILHTLLLLTLLTLSLPPSLFYPLSLNYLPHYSPTWSAIPFTLLLLTSPPYYLYCTFFMFPNSNCRYKTVVWIWRLWVKSYPVYYKTII